LAGSALIANAHSATAQTDPSRPQSHKPPDDWEFSLTPYLWMTSLRVEAQVGPVSSTAEECFTELLSNMDLGAQLRFEGRRGHWGFYLDGTYMSLGSDARARIGPFRVRGLDVDAEYTQAWLDFGGMYRFGEHGRSLDVMVGGRYAYVEADVSVGPFPDLNQSRDFLTPVVGARLQYALSDAWLLSLEGDVGGFGIGDAADLTWDITGLVGYQVSERTTLGIGYRYFALDYSSGALDLDLQIHGPIVGMSFQF
jgi:opacity protein-like surface antigen